MARTGNDSFPLAAAAHQRIESRMPAKRVFLALILLLLLCAPYYARASDDGQDTDNQSEKYETEHPRHSFWHKVVMYIPNRGLDLIDIFRLRLRLGPGLAVGVRATKPAQVYLGTYLAAYVGLPGPRMRRTPRLPFGMESHNGLDISLLEASASGGMSPDYSPTEFGAGLQLAVIGVDTGVDPVEIGDFFAGLIGEDIRNDDL